jgi:transposase
VTSSKALPTIWEVPDTLWPQFEAILANHYPPARTGRPRTDLRRVLDGVIFRLRSGCQWNHLPKEFGDDSTVHRWFQRWVDDGVFEELWALLLYECEALGAVDWRWQSADGLMNKSRFGGGATQPGAGSSSARSRGCKSAGRSSSDSTRRRRTILACSSSPAPCSGTGAYTGSARRWRRNLLSRLASPVVRQPVRRASSSNSRADDDKASRQDTRPQGGGDALRRADGVEAGDRLR